MNKLVAPKWFTAFKASKFFFRRKNLGLPIKLGGKYTKEAPSFLPTGTSSGLSSLSVDALNSFW
jgi:hypothetical protein